MLDKDQRDYLDYPYSRVEYANNQFLQLKDVESFEALRRELVDAKEIFESLIDQGQGDEWFDRKLHVIKNTLERMNEISPNSEDRVEQLKKSETISQEVFAYSERAMNKTIVPISKAIREIKFPVELEIKGEKYSTTNCWEARHFMTMDALAYLILKKLGFPRKAQTIFDNVEEIEKRAELLKSEDIVNRTQT